MLVQGLVFIAISPSLCCFSLRLYYIISKGQKSIDPWSIPDVQGHPSIPPSIFGRQRELGEALKYVSTLPTVPIKQANYLAPSLNASHWTSLFTIVAMFHKRLDQFVGTVGNVAFTFWFPCHITSFCQECDCTRRYPDPSACCTCLPCHSTSASNSPFPSIVCRQWREVS